MHPKWLKRIRRIISVIFLIVFSLFFLDFTTSIPEKLIQGFAYFQFIPSVLKFLRLPILLATGFILVLLLTFLFGRVYCSTVCPLGIFQDVISRIRRSFQKRKKARYHYAKAINWLRYSLLGVSVITLIFGIIAVVGLLDPYSIFGRIFSDLFRPLLVRLNNLAASVLQSMEVYSLYHVDLTPFHFSVVIVPVVFLVLLLIMAFKRGRLYCNTVCPVGTLLGWLSKFALFKVRIDKDTCTACQLCQWDCKAECISMETKSVDTSRCVMCFNCLTECPFNSIHYTPKLGFDSLNLKKDPKPEPAAAVPAGQNSGADRKRFLQFLGTAFLSLPLVSKIAKATDPPEIVSHSATVEIKRETPVSPPGSEDIERFNNKCTACHLCVSVCPTRVLQPAVNEYGWINIMQPRMDYLSGYCNYECTKCGDVCPTGAILPIKLEDKKREQLGKVQFVKENCIVETEGTDCGACAERCPTKAVYMVEYGDLFLPETNTDICIGCGACEFSCPVLPYKAIYVEGNNVHVHADPPKREDASDKYQKEDEDDFAF